MSRRKFNYVIFITSVAIIIVALFISIRLLLKNSHTVWQLASFGRSTHENRVEIIHQFDGSILMTSEGSGKMYLNGDDGLSFFYKELSVDDNFVLDAVLEIESWTLANGEDDGFGLMVCDSVGKQGDTNDYWNNSYMALATKVEYRYNEASGQISNIGTPIIMRQGIAAREKIGNRESHPKDEIEAAANQKVTQVPLENSMAEAGAGTYNILGNYTEISGMRAPTGTVSEEQQLTSLHLRIQRDNTGYRISYITPEGVENTKLFYDLKRNHLSEIDSDHIYVGVFVTRHVSLTIRDLKLSVTDAKNDPPAEERQMSTLEPDYRIISSDTSGTEEHTLIFQGNADGRLSVRDDKGKVIVEGQPVTANEEAYIHCQLHEGKNRFDVTFIPKEGFKFDESTRLSDESVHELEAVVTYRRYGQENGLIYVSPSGTAIGEGTFDSPLDIYTAIGYVIPGQTIILNEGEYLLEQPLEIKRGMDGTEKQPICIISNPSNETRPVLSFQKHTAGIILAGDYWYMNGFDVTETLSGEYGIHVSGNYNKLERLEVYRNGNTGIHISRLLPTDKKEKWPSYNYILNCTSYGNSDDAYEDADGFAAQFSAGEGNVFEGCIAHHNADDGWDLYSKIWLGNMGAVTIRNCIAYANGYLEDGTDAGNGNGFKLGGDGMSGKHILENCLSFHNKSAGITSNSCPDIRVYNCTSFDNGTANIQLNCKNTENTDFQIEGVLSAKTSGSESSKRKEIIQSKGIQRETGIYNPSNFFWKPEEQAAVNSEGVKYTAEAIFVSIKFEEGKTITRDRDGNLCINDGFLKLKEKKLIEEKVGAYLSNE